MKVLLQKALILLLGLIPGASIRRELRDEYTRTFLKQIHNVHIRHNVQTAISPRDAAIVVVQDALELAGGGRVQGRIENVREEKGMIVVDYIVHDLAGSIAYMPFPAHMRGLHGL